MPGFDYHRPESLEDAFRLKSELPGARFIAGGTDVMVRIREGRLRPPALISLSRVRELAGIRHGDEIRIGAMTRVAELLRDEELGRSAPVLALAARTLGGMQVRNLATVGGNLCNASPCADTAPPLLVLDARVVVRSPGSERELPLADFFVAPGETRIGEGEIVSEIRFRRPDARTRATFFKKSRVRMDIAIASLAARVDMDGRRCVVARLAAGSAAPRPMRLPRAEALLEGHDITAELLDELCTVAAAEVEPMTDVRSTEAYRRHVIGVFARRALARLSGLEEAR
jgi:carbon-monoxide dehydrogenase medium subunit